MTKFYYILYTIFLFQIQKIFGAMNVTIGEIENSTLNKINVGNNNSGNNVNITAYICPAANNKFCIGRGDPNYIVPKSYGTEKIDGIFTDLTKLDGYENNKSGAIVEACNEKSLKDKKCQTRKCAMNEDCLSNLCQSGSCVTNPDNPLMECEEIGGIMICKKYLQEKCIRNEECAGRCKRFLCTYRNLNSLNNSTYLYSSAAIVSGICFILLFCCCLCCPGLFSCWKVKRVRNNNNPPVVV
ncbi:hypothetical protein BCR36DRAFT_401467 [Piromyces finnis]|uniref:Uncharacterized protein n=1 Tax=Piromyces finnis TaxID=1754191 RepID=A0A1Y1VLT7_9FUNG|nr:hypothetical protein BCR36DRAFT_401467 [Piromyces finnis]|eukprot:ORX59868.1 hypothetical protein BCR36DRAFT_401467 [Piromyces finnis]